MVTMETRTSKWVWSSILYRWPTLWCSWAPIFSVSSLCLGRKNTFSIFVLLKFINLVAHICLKLILLWMFHVTFSQLSPVARFPTSVTCLEVRMRTSTVFFLFGLFYLFHAVLLTSSVWWSRQVKMISTRSDGVCSQLGTFSSPSGKPLTTN